MADTVGQIYYPDTPAELRDQGLRDVRLLAIEAGIDDPPVEPGTDWYASFDSFARIAYIGIGNGKIADDNSSVLTATKESLEELRERFGVEKQLPSGSTGRVIVGIVGSTTINDGQLLLLPNGLRIQVVGNYPSPSDQDEIEVRAVDTGEETNLDAGELVRFVSPPINVKTEAYVSKSAPLTGGVSEETDERKRRRIRNKLANAPSGGNWAHIRAIALRADGSLDDCFVYPAIGGPATFLAVPVRPMNAKLKQFTRAPSLAQLQTIREKLFAEYPDAVNVKVRAPLDETISLGIEIQIPDSTLSGGNGQGWVDGTPWPDLIGADNGRVSISNSALNGKKLTLTANTTTAPTALVTNISWWSTNDGKFYTSLITEVNDTTPGAYIVTLQTPFVDSDGDPAQVGEYISPAAVNIQRYGDTWLTLFGGMGPGEMVSSGDSRLPRANRHPYTSREWPSDWADALLRKLVDSHREITNWSREYASATTPTIPSTVDDQPRILTPGNVGFYQL